MVTVQDFAQDAVAFHTSTEEGKGVRPDGEDWSPGRELIRLGQRLQGGSGPSNLSMIVTSAPLSAASVAASAPAVPPPRTATLTNGMRFR